MIKAIQESFACNVQMDSLSHIKMKRRLYAPPAIQLAKIFVLRLGQKAVLHVMRAGSWIQSMDAVMLMNVCSTLMGVRKIVSV